MTQYKRIAIDTSKAVFTFHGIDARSGRSCGPIFAAGNVAFFRKLPPPR